MLQTNQSEEDNAEKSVERRREIIIKRTVNIKVVKI